MQNIFRFPLHLTNGSRSTCCCSSCMQSGEVQFRSCRLFCPVHETSISPQVTESGLRLRFNEQSPPFSPALCRGQVPSPPGKYQPLFGNIEILCSVLALFPSTECWNDGHLCHLTSPFPALTGSWATWRHFYQIWTSWRPGGEGEWRVESI